MSLKVADLQETSVVLSEKIGKTQIA